MRVCETNSPLPAMAAGVTEFHSFAEDLGFELMDNKISYLDQNVQSAA